MEFAGIDQVRGDISIDGASALLAGGFSKHRQPYRSDLRWPQYRPVEDKCTLESEWCTDPGFRCLAFASAKSEASKATHMYFVQDATPCERHFSDILKDRERMLVVRMYDHVALRVDDVAVNSDDVLVLSIR